ncbi:RYamide neuropeptides [Lutzomyia longipalpis]|uniref:RYamide neuropeptides n=1 Tax=Lutzomyia longipalpis TaxID=7200 RepID=UPI002483AAFD|nr:RYamide neuropeptides [Lutzomyia longipalpis]
MVASTILPAFLILAIALSLTRCETNQDDFQASDMKSDAIKRPFFVGSRYGRSQYYGPKALRQVNVAPRNDRFFLGSRYGKRSQELMTTLSDQNFSAASNDAWLMCIYTGVSNLYRCNGNENSSPSDTGAE